MNTSRRSRGFTLIELMIVVAVIAILAGIAYPSYVEHGARARRADAKAALSENAHWLERQYTVSSAYNTTGDGRAIDSAALPTQQSPKTGTRAYTIRFRAGEPTASTFLLEAVPTGGMTGDRCGTLTLTNAGVRGSADTLANCWDR